MKRISMQDVAVAAGVSRMTVSYALRNSPEVSAETRTRIQKLADELGYRPDPLLQRLGLRLHETRDSTYSGTLAYLVGSPQWLSRHPYRIYHHHARERAVRLGYKLETFWPEGPRATGKQMSRILVSRGIEGLIIAPLPAAFGHLRLDWSKFAIAAVGYSMVRPQVHRAANHQLHTAREAFRQLQRLGYRRIGLCIEASHNRRVDYNWEQGLLFHQSRQPQKNRIPTFPGQIESRRDILDWVERTRPDCILAQGRFVYEQLRAAGYRIPEDLGYAVLDWTAEHPEIAGTDQRDDQIGMAAVDLVTSQLSRNEKGLPEVPRTLMIEGCWRHGASASPAPNRVIGR